MDRADLGRVDPATLKQIIATFEDEVLPRASAEIGEARDVDGDGRFAILMSRWLGHLADGRLAVDGFVRGSDFEADLAPPLGNAIDMMYLSADLSEGPHLRTVIAHEYTHAVTYCAKASGPSRGDEEGWLDEGLAHLAEDLHGFSRTNLDYRVAAFLASPEQYRLLVDDYAVPSLVRSHGHRGSAYLFLRWCVDHHGPALFRTLVRSDLRGVKNLESATGSTFASLYRGWSASLFLDTIAPSSSPDRDPPSVRRLVAGEEDVATLDGTTTHFAIVDGATTGAVSIEVEGSPEAAIQVTAVLLPGDLPRIDLAAEIELGGSEGPVLRARIHGPDPEAVRFETLRWSPVQPSSDAAERDRLSGRLEGEALNKSLGTHAMEAEGQIVSGPIPLSSLPDGPLSVVLVGRDAKGRRIVARAEVAPVRPSEPDP